MSAAEDDRLLIVEAGRAGGRYWRDLWRYRDLWRILCRRDLVARYRQTTIGIIWAFIHPLMTIVAFTVLLGKVAKLPSEPGAPYSVLVFSGVLIWTFFSQCLTGAGASLLANGHLVSKVYLPRLLIPVSAVALAAADFLVSLVLFAGLLLWFGLPPAPQCLFLPAFLLLAGLLALGPGLILAALSLPYRDVVHITPVLLQLAMFASPVLYASSLAPEKWRWLYMLNPLVGLVDGFRWALLGVPAFPAAPLLISCLWAAALLWAGLGVFRRLERAFADTL